MITLRTAWQHPDAVRRLRRWSFLGLVAMALVWYAAQRLTWNQGHSLDPLGYPLGPYLVHPLDRPIQRGDLITATIHGKARTHIASVLKIVRGLPGDRVTWRGRDVYINGEFLGTAKEYSLAGEPLARGPEGVIPPGHFFLWTPHKDSYDSRYADIGWVPAQWIRGFAEPLLPMRKVGQEG